MQRFDLCPASLSDAPSFNLTGRGEFVPLLREWVSKQSKVSHPSVERQRSVHLVETTAKQRAEFVAFEEGGPLLGDPMLTRQRFKQGAVGDDEDSQIRSFIADQTGFFNERVLFEQAFDVLRSVVLAF